jgi:hypothetical protein
LIWLIDILVKASVARLLDVSGCREHGLQGRISPMGALAAHRRLNLQRMGERLETDQTIKLGLLNLGVSSEAFWSFFAFPQAPT